MKTRVSHRGEIEVVEYLYAVLPWIGIPIFPHTLLIEAIYLCDLTGFMVPSQKSNVCRVPSLETHQQLKGLYAIMTAIHVVSLQRIKTAEINSKTAP